MNPKDGKEKWKEYTLLYLLWENIFISRIPKGGKNCCNASYQRSKPSILFLTTPKTGMKERTEGLLLSLTPTVISFKTYKNI